MAFDSSIRVRQINQIELSGYLTNIIQGYLSQTGLLTGAFYPLAQNPAGYEISGAFISQQDLDSAIAQNTSYIFDTIPEGGGGNISQTGSYIFHTAISSGITQQFIHFPTDLGSNPYVFCSLVNTGSNGKNIFVWPSGITHSGYWAQFSWPIFDSNYSLITLASFSTQTGLATTVIIQSGLPANGIFTDSSSNSSLDVYNRELIGNWDVIGGLSVSGNAVVTNNQTGNFGGVLPSDGILTGFNNQPSVDWINKLLYDSQMTEQQAVSLDWNGRMLYYDNTWPCIDWSQGVIYDNSNYREVSLDWNNRILSGDWDVIGGLSVSGNAVVTNNQTGSYIFHTAISSGITQQFINFPSDLGSNPNIFCSLVNTGSNSKNILVWPSGVTHSGYWAQFSWPIYDGNYSLITLASLSSQTGLATTVIIQSGLPVNGIFTDSSSNSSLDVYNRELIGNWSVNSGMNISGVLNYQGTGAVTTQVPINTGVPKSWMPITVTGVKYFIPLFQ